MDVDHIPGIGNLNRRLAGWPDSSLTVLLVTLGLAVIFVALFAPPVVKAGVAAWVIFP